MGVEPGINRVTIESLARMSRPSHLLLITTVYGLGAAIAVARGAPIGAIRISTGLLALLPVAASVHYANEYADHETDALTVRTPFSGGSGALPETGLHRSIAIRAAQVSLGLGLGFAVICLLHGYPITALGVLVIGAVLGWQYSVPPLKLAWRGMGELDNALAGGLLLPAYGYAVSAGTVDPVVVLATVPFFALVFANLLDTTWPDRQADVQVGKATLATQWSRRRLRSLYLVAVSLWIGSTLVLRGSVLPPLVADAGLVVFPLVLWGYLRYTRSRSPFPTVSAMVLTAIIHLLAWSWVGLR